MKHTPTTRPVLLFLLCLAVVLTACRKNTPPTIADILGPDTAFSLQMVGLTCDAFDADGDSLVYDWVCTAGGLHSGNEAHTNWFAPETACDATISVTAKDRRGGADHASKDICVKAVYGRFTWLDWHGTVPAKSAYYWNRPLLAGDSLSGHFDVADGPITLLVLTESNFNKFFQGVSYEAVLKVADSPRDTFACSIISKAEYYLLVCNYDEQTSRTVNLYVEHLSPEFVLAKTEPRMVTK